MAIETKGNDQYRATSAYIHEFKNNAFREDPCSELYRIKARDLGGLATFDQADALSVGLAARFKQLRTFSAHETSAGNTVNVGVCTPWASRTGIQLAPDPTSAQGQAPYRGQT